MTDVFRTGLHQKSVLGPGSFVMLMRKLVAEVKQESLRRWTSAADSVFWVRSREQVGRKSKTEYKCVTERGAGWRVKMREAEMVSKDDFCHLGFPIQVTDSEQKRWRMRGRRRELWQKDSNKCEKGKVYKTGVEPAMMYGLETVSLSHRQEAELRVAELKMLRFSTGK